MTDHTTADQADNKEIRAGFELCYAVDADDPANASDLNHFTNGWRACIMSQVRAEGVQAGDERAAFEAWAADQLEPARERHPWLIKNSAGDYSFGSGQDWWKGWQARAALASAPVAGEAPADDEIIDMAVEPLGIDCDRMPYGVVIFARALLARYAAPQASEAVRIVFPAHLRRMWSGGEVQAWLDEHHGVTTPKPSAKDSLDRYQKWQAKQVAADGAPPKNS